VTFRSPKLLAASQDQCCVRCGKTEGVVGAHYTGVRRLQLGGGYGIKVHDFLTADLCQECHGYMDTISREKEKRYGHSEEFFYYIALTWERRFLQGIVVVARKGMDSGRVELLARPDRARAAQSSGTESSPELHPRDLAQDRRDPGAAS
jgi:hypothetical protein